MADIGAFHYTGFAQEVILGPGALARLGAAVERFSWRRLLLCATGSAQRRGWVAQIESELGERLIATFARVQPHVQDFQVAEALALAVEAEVDAVIGLGGGSPIGLAKAVGSALEEKRVGRPARAAFPTDQPLVPVVAIPTTYAGSEMTPVYGITHRQADGSTRKVTVNDPKLAPKLVIYDPSLTLDLPPEMTASTGINALAHCVEAAYSITRHPLSTAAAVDGARHIVRALPRCYSVGDDLAARAEMLMGAHLAGFALSSVAMGVHHGLCHVLGGSAGVPHGVANAIMLPHVMRFNADATGTELAPVAEAMGIGLSGLSAAAAVEAAAQKVYDLVGALNLPQRLSDAGVNETDLPGLAGLAFQNRTVRNNPKPIVDAAQIEGVLRAAW
ncbi:MAG TPA: iron-containing alcohol dehydrogenase family protein [Anaerolineae bacterium]|nr:iron-containing alcohol dehydrogenase family protein [Anaerolineae bacterium]